MGTNSRWWFVLAVVPVLMLMAGGVACGGDDDDDDATSSVDDDAVDDDDTSDDDIGDDDDDTADDDTGPDPVDLAIPAECNPFSMTDSPCVLPYPSAFFQKATTDGVRMVYPDGSVDLGEGNPPLDMAPVNRHDGASPAGPILAHFAFDVPADALVGQKEIEKSLIDDAPIALWDWDTGERVAYMAEMDANLVEGYDNRYALIIRPAAPMALGHRYLVALTKDVCPEESACESPAAFEALRDGVITTDERVEGARDDYEDYFEFLADEGYASGELLTAWDFHVATQDTVLGPILSMRRQVFDQSAGDGFEYVIDEVIDNPSEYATRAIKGRFFAPTFIDGANNLVFDENGAPVRQATDQEFPFTMILPNKALDGDPLPLAIIGHGIFGTGEEYLLGFGSVGVAHKLAEQVGAVLLATDWIGLSGADQELIFDEVVPDLNKLGIVTDRLAQSLVNNLTLIELGKGALSTDPQIKVGANAVVDPTRVYYYGISLGGIQGTGLVSISRDISRAVIAVPGGTWANILPRSVVYKPIKKNGVDPLYPDPLTQQLMIAFFQYRFDLSDPANLGRLLLRDPLPDAPESRTVLMQESIGDAQIPNMATEILGRAVGAKQLMPAVASVWGLPPDDAPTDGVAFGQYYLPYLVDLIPPPESNTPPGFDNQVHGLAPFLPQAQEQVATLVSTGVIDQFCDGACDPD
ncbi:MAG: hypothetical protein H6685_02285 [Deltaproteobacteria bacterium]|nr:hypothetical protein [Deltaproteobacteria bacterium]